MSIAPDTPDPVTKKSEKASSRRGGRYGDWNIASRVLGYARPFRARMGAALGIGLLAGLLTALNLVALVPVLEILLDQTSKDKIERIEREVQEYRQEVAEAKTIARRADRWINLKKTEFRLEWNRWVLKWNERAIYMIAAALLIAQILKSILDFISKYILQRSFYLAMVRLRTDLYERCLRLDFPEFQKITSGDLISRMNNDMRAVRVVFTSMVSNAILQPFTIISLFLVMLFLNWQLTLVVIVGVPLFVLPLTYFGKRLRTMGKKDEEEDAKLLGYSQERIQGLMIVKAFMGERRELKRFRKLSREVAERQIGRERLRLYSEPLVEIAASVALAGVLCIGAYLVLKSSNAGMSASEFLIYIGVLTRFYPPIKRISASFIKMQKSLASAERIFEIIDLPSSIPEAKEPVELGPLRDRIAFEDIVFAYGPGKAPALNGFSLEIPRGRRIALVGRTGAGKSTVARLLPRFYDVTSGRILVDGVDIRQARVKSLRRQMALVTQDTILFDDTILNNIRYGRPEATREQVEEAARAAYAHEFIESMPLGYDTEIGERGGQLSGGQRQRLAIARALLADKPILILDEATSALDNESESIVQRAIDRLMENRTSIVIAHRLSTVRKADEIVVMEAGRIVERGAYAELIEARGRFFDLVQREELAGE